METPRSVSQMLEPVADASKSAAHSVAASIAPVTDWLRDQSENLSATQKKLVDESCAYVSKNPMKAVGAALVVGAVLAIFASRRH